ncbi:MAG: phosphate ABC transporter substrate-binding protein PstS [Roseiflexaceae bacterium]|jgi:phosphate transport system substrate-binding protein|nr:phosphate ABC transporter substrate-binding protein PstS [Chloroflexaceae bacterium]
MSPTWCRYRFMVLLMIVMQLLVACGAQNADTAMPQGESATKVKPTHVVPISDWQPRQLTAALGGSGATFPNPFYQVLISVYTTHIVPTVQISYQSVGSGQGKKDFISGLTDFGGTDSPISADDIASQVPDAIHIPMVLGGVMPLYNLPTVMQPLRFSAETLVGIYMGEITMWNDARIGADNPGVALPELPIAVVYRSDASGTTSIWTDYLSKVSETWKTAVGKGSSVQWLVGIGAPGNAGIANTVQSTEGAIGYVEVGYALSTGLPLPFVKNAAGMYVQPTLANVSAAAANVVVSDDVQQLAQSITNGSDPQSYPIAAFTYVLVHKDTYADLTKAQALADFVYWGLTIGQDAAVRLGYAPLPTNVRHAAIRALAAITVDGQQVIDAPVR